MARYLIEASRLPAAEHTALEALGSWLSSAVPSLQGTVEIVNYSFGEHDLIAIVDMPDESAMMTLAEQAISDIGLKLAKAQPLIPAGDVHSAKAAARWEPAVQTSVEQPPAAASPTQVSSPDDEAPEHLELNLESAPEEEMPDEVQALVADLLMGDVAPDAYDVAVGRFTRFSELAAFTETLQGVPGISSIVTRQFLRGMVSLRIHYNDPIPLATRLADMSQFKPLVRPLGQNRLEMILFASTRGGQIPSDGEEVPPEDEGPASGAEGGGPDDLPSADLSNDPVMRDDVEASGRTAGLEPPPMAGASDTDGGPAAVALEPISRTARGLRFSHKLVIAALLLAVVGAICLALFSHTID